MLSFLSLSAFLVAFLFQSSVSINCTDEEVEWETGRILRKSKSCGGNLCMNYTNGNQIDKTCITTGAFNISNGCIQYDDNDPGRILCFCDTDFCNRNKYSGTPRIMKQSTCTTTVPGSDDTHTTAPLCSVRVVRRGSKRTVQRTAEIDLEVVLPVPPARQASLEFFTYLIGIVHITTGIEQNLKTHDYKCYGNDCNDKVEIDDFNVKRDVSCHTNREDFCLGEFCVFATNGTTDLKYCLSTHKIGGIQNYEVGIFKYKLSTFYLCKEGNCNSDEETAKLSIAQKHSQKVDEEEPPPSSQAGVNSYFYYSTILTVTVLFYSN